MQIMTGQSSQRAFSPLGGGAMVVYASGNTYYRHADWLARQFALHVGYQ